MTRQDQIEHLRADLATVRSYLNELGDDDVVARATYAARARRLEQSIDRLDAPHGRFAQMAFEVEGDAAGDPEVMLDVAARLRAVVRSVAPNADMVKPLRIVRSEGNMIVLEEAIAQAPLVGQTELATATDEALRVLAVLSGDESMLAEGVADVEPAALESAGKLFQVLQREHLGIALKVGAVSAMHAGPLDVERGAARAAAQRSETSDVPVEGTLTGIFVQARRFEFAPLTGAVIRGRIARAADATTLVAWILHPCTARFRVVSLELPGQLPTRSYTLERIENVSGASTATPPTPAPVTGAVG